MRGKLGLNAFTLKVIAIAAMTVDHVGYVFFPTAIWMRVIGRLTMPIMAFFIAEGYAHTRDVKRYALRLLMAAALSAVPFSLAFGMTRLGVMWTLLLGLIALHAYTSVKNLPLRFLCVLACVLLSLVGDWPIFGVLMVLGFGLTRESFPKQAMALTAILIAQLLSSAVALPRDLWMVAGVLALPLIYLYDGQRGPDARWLFYLYYPAHLLAIWLIRIL